MNNRDNNDHNDDNKADFLAFLSLLGEATRRNQEKENEEAFNQMAKFEKQLYDAYLKAGFNEEQALTLAKGKAEILFASVFTKPDPRIK